MRWIAVFVPLAWLDRGEVRFRLSSATLPGLRKVRVTQTALFYVLIKASEIHRSEKNEMTWDE